MGETIRLAAVGPVTFMVLDGVWLGLLMKNFHRDQLAPIVRLADGGIAPNWPAASSFTFCSGPASPSS
jgi:hypothetical protein